MQTITAVGEISITFGDDFYHFRPSLLAISRLGTPEEIVKIFATVMSATKNEYQSKVLYMQALHVIQTCETNGQDITPLFGHMGGEFEIIFGAAHSTDAVHLARSLLMHGIVGDYPQQSMSGNNDDYTKEFLARDIVSMAIAHLGMSESEAWGMTMTGFAGAVRAKYPEIRKKEEQIKNLEKLDDWADMYEKALAIEHAKNKRKALKEANNGK